MDTNFIISLDSIADVNAFANTIAHFKSEIDLSSGRYIVNAKSIMVKMNLKKSALQLHHT